MKANGFSTPPVNYGKNPALKIFGRCRLGLRLIMLEEIIVFSWVFTSITYGFSVYLLTCGILKKNVKCRYRKRGLFNIFIWAILFVFEKNTYGYQIRWD
jgi:hypothetical protein